MHHYGATELALNTSYTFKWDPFCPYDLGNAVAMCYFRGLIKAYLTREDAAVISELFHGSVIQGKVIGKTFVNAHVCKHDLGPQQEFSLVFKVAQKYDCYVSSLLTMKLVEYTNN